MERFGLIYRVLSPSDKSYIGQTIRPLWHRKRQHIEKAYNRKSQRYNTKLSCAIRKYNDDLLWEIIEEHIEIKCLDEREIHYIQKYASYENGYNHDRGGRTQRNKIVSAKTKKKLSMINKGKKLSEETKKKISLSNKGKHFKTTEFKQKLSNDRLGKNNPMYGVKLSSERKDINSKCSKHMWNIIHKIMEEKNISCKEARKIWRTYA